MKKRFKDEKLKRAMIAFDCRFVNDFAKLFDITPQNLNGYINRNTFIDLIKYEAVKRGINLDWIKTGEGSMMLEQSGVIAEQQAPYPDRGANPAPPGIGSLIDQTIEVLKSDTKYARALKENIEAFHQAVNETKKPCDPTDAADGGSKSAASIKAAK